MNSKSPERQHSRSPRPVEVWTTATEKTVFPSATAAARHLGVQVSSITIPCWNGGGRVAGKVVAFKGALLRPADLPPVSTAARPVQVRISGAWVTFPSATTAAAQVGAAHSSVSRALKKAAGKETTCNGFTLRYLEAA